tara:strand:+ start:112 stop:1281 length:1170 start_codon:yes stop_codon:yes gene_type:complete
LFSILKKYNKIIVLFVVALLFQSVSTNTYAAPPLLPMVFSGTITVNSGDSPDGKLLVGRIFDSNGTILYTSNSVSVSGNNYIALTLGPIEPVVVGKEIKFYFLCGEIPCTEAATETSTYASAKVKFRYSLTFANVPPSQAELDAAAKAKADVAAAAKAKADEDAAKAIAKAKSDADAAAKAKADATAAKAKADADAATAKAKADTDAAKQQSQTEAAATSKETTKVESDPKTAFPSVYSGSIVVAGTQIPSDAVLTAKIGDYTSPPAIISGNSFQNLVISPGNSTFIDKSIIFMLNNVQSEPINELYTPGSTKNINLVFVGLPVDTKVAENEEPKEISSSTPTDTADSSSGSNCSFVSSNRNNNYSGAISLALMLLVPMIAFKSKRIKK